MKVACKIEYLTHTFKHVTILVQRFPIVTIFLVGSRKVLKLIYTFHIIKY